MTTSDRLAALDRAYRFFVLVGVAGLVLVVGGAGKIISDPGSSATPVAAGLVGAGLVLVYGNRKGRASPSTHG